MAKKMGKEILTVAEKEGKRGCFGLKKEDFSRNEEHKSPHMKTLSESKHEEKNCSGKEKSSSTIITKRSAKRATHSTFEV